MGHHCHRPGAPAYRFRSRIAARHRFPRFCPFCEGHESKTPPEVLAYRNGSAPNHPGWSLRVIPNKFPVLEVEGDLDREGEGLFDRMHGVGAHEVVVEAPQHALGVTELSDASVEQVLWAFRDRVLDLERTIAGCATYCCSAIRVRARAPLLEHTHSQLISSAGSSKRVQEEIEVSQRYFDFKERCLFCDLVQEMKTGTRIVTETEHFVVVEPYAARFPLGSMDSAAWPSFALRGRRCPSTEEPRLGS